jgi:hypothetical protein
MKHIVALSRTAVIMRHWFEIDLDDASMEHGARIELRQLSYHAHRGSESAAQLVTADRPLWRADLFDRLADKPGSYGVAHFHPRFTGNEPCPRHWDPELTASPWEWLRDQFASLGASQGGPAWPVAGQDADELRGLGPEIVSLASGFAPDRCSSAAECFDRTRDVRRAVQLMISGLRRPDLLDTGWIAPWATGHDSAGAGRRYRNRMRRGATRAGRGMTRGAAPGWMEPRMAG